MNPELRSGVWGEKLRSPQRMGENGSPEGPTGVVRKGRKEDHHQTRTFKGQLEEGEGTFRERRGVRPCSVSGRGFDQPRALQAPLHLYPQGRGRGLALVHLNS